MKKIYVKPSVEEVRVDLFGSVLEDPNPGVGRNSYVATEMDAKQGFSFSFDDDFGDIWGDDSSKKDSYDLWGEN
jgi:hypothetical protein